MNTPFFKPLNRLNFTESAGSGSGQFEYISYTNKGLLQHRNKGCHMNFRAHRRESTILPNLGFHRYFSRMKSQNIKNKTTSKEKKIKMPVKTKY